jgi:hypothetical protein
MLSHLATPTARTVEERIADMSTTLRPEPAPEPEQAKNDLAGIIDTSKKIQRDLAKHAPRDYSDVMIATPLSWDHIYKRNALAQLALDKGGASGQWLDGDAIDEMRNKAIGMAREQGKKWLLFTDADMNYPPDALRRLLSHDKKIVGGLCRQRRRPFKMCLWDLLDEPGNPDDGYLCFIDPKTVKPINDAAPWQFGLRKVDATGGAFLLINMEVFDAIDEKMPHIDGSYFLDARQIPGLKPQERVSEDMWFCALARACGYELFVDIDLRIGHYTMAEIIDDGTPDHLAQVRQE